jgi:hypothetical protein
MKVFASLGGGVWRWLATRAASFWIAAAAAAVITWGLSHYQNLRECCAELRGQKAVELELQDYINNLTELAQQGIEWESDADINAAKANDDACLSSELPNDLADRLRD